MHKDVLLTPGPTPLLPQVQEALSRPIIHHRTSQYRAIFTRVLQGLQAVFKTKESVVVFTSSGTGAMEASVCNLLSPGDTAIAILGGKFAERWQALGKAFGVNMVTVPVAYGDAVDPQQVKQALAANPQAKAVFGTLCETSTGVVHDIQALASITKQTPAALVIDGISGLGADDCETDAWGVDMVVSGSQKALMLPPGLAFMSVSQKAWKLVESSTCPKYYFDLKLYRKALADDDTPFTSNVSGVVALDEALKSMLEIGMPAVLATCRTMAEATRAGVEGMGLSLFSKRPSNGVTAIQVPEGIDGKKLVNVIADRYRVRLAGGQGEMAGKLFRFAHMGYIGPFDILVGLAAVELSLIELGWKGTPGEGLKAAQAVIGRAAKQPEAPRGGVPRGDILSEAATASRGTGVR